MNGRSLKQSVRIRDPLGFHVRPKAAFARAALAYAGSVKVTWAGQTADGKSMLDLMLLAAPQGSEMTVEVNGPNPESVLATLVAVLRDPGEEEAVESPSPDHLRESTSEPV